MTTPIQTRSHTVRLSRIGMIRDLFDSAEGRITAQHLPEIAAKTGFHPTTVRLQFYRWRAESNTVAARLARGE